MGAYRDQYLLEKTLELKEKYNSKIFIETGTADGDSMVILHNHFDELYSCENTKKGYELSQLNTIECRNVHIFNQDSILFMEDMCDIFQDRKDLIFFLDAHFGDYSPLLDELEAINKYKITCPIIIHDFYVPDENGNAKFLYDKYTGGNLDFNYVKDKIDKIFNNSYDMYMPDKVIEPSGYAIFTKK